MEKPADEGGLSHDYSPSSYLAVDRLPLPIRRRYLRACAVWRTIHDHHRAIMRLLAEAMR